MTDLAQLYEWELEKAIETNDRANIAKYLRERAGNLSPEIVKKLADYLDPENMKIYKSGPKPKRRIKHSCYFRDRVIGDFFWFCKDRELARYILNSDREAFFIIEGSELLDSEGNFSPQWKYPLAKSTRKNVKLPKKGEIKSFVCEMYNIGSRTFDALLSAYNKNK